MSTSGFPLHVKGKFDPPGKASYCGAARSSALQAPPPRVIVELEAE